MRWWDLINDQWVHDWSRFIFHNLLYVKSKVQTLGPSSTGTIIYSFMDKVSLTEPPITTLLEQTRKLKTYSQTWTILLTSSDFLDFSIIQTISSDPFFFLNSHDKEPSKTVIYFYHLFSIWTLKRALFWNGFVPLSNSKHRKCLQASYMEWIQLSSDWPRLILLTTEFSVLFCLADIHFFQLSGLSIIWTI